eukprot:TRINITY_DN7019_c0_g1_i2.p2 TRINITY_DN7019_c0_g1~~TRINITY_DN7019_c0_g1_i2.p2  ORF type:complete len:127 (-),score=66.96 TRINITY_DN7019_c0_g1_i2:14-394(-)
MHRVFAVQFSGDAQYVLSGSDDSNVRIWKSEASAPLRVVTGREKRAIEYRKALRKRFSHMPEVAKIERAQRLPKLIFKVTKQRKIQNDAAKRKDANVAAHSRLETAEELKSKKTTVKKKAVISEFD